MTGPAGDGSPVTRPAGAGGPVTRTVLALGSNLGDRLANLQGGLDALLPARASPRWRCPGSTRRRRSAARSSRTT